MVTNIGTFGAWIAGQEQRSDKIGEMARYWATLKGNQRIRALPSVEAKLREAGALEPGTATLEWWQATVSEYRALKNQPTTMSGRPLSGPTGIVPEPAAGLPPGLSQAPDGTVSGTPATAGVYSFTGSGPEVRGNPLPPAQLGFTEPLGFEAMVIGTLDIHSRFLAAICVRLGLSATRVQEIFAELGITTPADAMAAGQPDPVNWPWVSEHADYDAAEGEL